AAATAGGLLAVWQTLALYWYGWPDGIRATSQMAAAAAAAADPILGRPLGFYLFTLPAWELLSGWVLTLAVIACAIAGFFVVISGGSRLVTGRRGPRGETPWRGLSIAFAALLATLAVRIYLSRFERLLDDHTIFAGATYTDAHITLTGLLLVSIALFAGAVIAVINAFGVPRVRWLVAAV